MRLKEDIVTFLVVIATLAFFIFTPSAIDLGPALQGFIIALVFFGFLPLGYHFLIRGGSAEQFGLLRGDARRGTFESLVAAALLFVLTVVLYKLFPVFGKSYELPLRVTESFSWFLVYELLLVPITLVLFEIFFRGFVQQSWLVTRFGWLAVLVQGALFIIFLLATKSLGLSTLHLAFLAFVSGAVVYRTRSLWYALATGWLYLLLLDVYFLIIR
jgi:membrane protease YdiL (CAAX protease family)